MKKIGIAIFIFGFFFVNVVYAGPFVPPGTRPPGGFKQRSKPRIFHFPRPSPLGHRITILPRGYLSMSVAGLSYFYFSGSFYRNFNNAYVVVQAPIGAVIPLPPPGYRIIHYDDLPYYYSSGSYYQWDQNDKGYRVVPPPEEVAKADVAEKDSFDIFMYPKSGQNEEEQAKDRDECHQWAVGQTDYDPELEFSSEEKKNSDFKRAISACLEGRNYSVK